MRGNDRDNLWAERIMTDGQRDALQAMLDEEAGLSPWKNLAYAEECEERGWAEANSDGHYRITLAGRAAYSAATAKRA